jgi:hypothetical protein
MLNRVAPSKTIQELPKERLRFLLTPSQAK